MNAPAPVRAHVITHGCRSNLAEADALARLAPAGHSVINSCAVTNQAVKDARAAARAALAHGPVWLTGCAASATPDRFADLPLTLIPAAAKLLPASWGRAGTTPAAVTRRSRAFVAIQDGCDHACTFCITTIARGPSRSMPPARIIDSIRTLADSGVNEVVLTGIDTTSYGQDQHPRTGLGALIEAILAAVPDLPRLRLSSLDAAEADDALIAAFAHPRLMPHIHLSLQHGDDLLLRRMARRHRRADALALIARLRAARPDIAIGADLIAGFPTESEAAHAASLALIADAGLTHAHIFPFSPRPATHAATLPPLPPATIRARAAELRAAAAQQHRAAQMAQIGRETCTISEGEKGISPHGFAIRYARPRPKGALATIVPTHISTIVSTHISNDMLSE